MSLVVSGGGEKKMFIKRYREKRLSKECFSSLCGFCLVLNACIVPIWIYHRICALGFTSTVAVTGPVQKHQYMILLNKHRNTHRI